jgi:hypothetical protein
MLLVVFLLAWLQTLATETIASDDNIEGTDCASVVIPNDKSSTWITKYPDSAIVGSRTAWIYSDPKLTKRLFKLVKEVKLNALSVMKDGICVDEYNTGSCHKIQSVLKVSYQGTVGYMSARNVIVENPRVRFKNKNHFIYYNNVGCSFSEIGGIYISDFSFWLQTPSNTYTFLGVDNLLPGFNAENFLDWSPQGKNFYSNIENTLFDANGAELLKGRIDEGPNKRNLVFPMWIDDNELFFRNNVWEEDDSIYTYDVKKRKLTRVFKLSGTPADYGSGDYPVFVEPLNVDKKKRSIQTFFARDVEGIQDHYYDIVVTFDGKLLSKKSTDINHLDTLTDPKGE